MNSYFDDDQEEKKLEEETSLGTLGNGTADADISKMFESNEKPAEATSEAKPEEKDPKLEMPVMPVDSTASEDIAPTPGFTIEPEKSSIAKEDNANPFVDNAKPAPIAPLYTASASDSTGSLADTEAKLKKKKDEITAEMKTLEDKQKKIDETLEKIASLKTQEDEILKAAQEID